MNKNQINAINRLVKASILLDESITKGIEVNGNPCMTLGVITNALKLNKAVSLYKKHFPSK